MLKVETFSCYYHTVLRNLLNYLQLMLHQFCIPVTFYFVIHFILFHQDDIPLYVRVSGVCSVMCIVRYIAQHHH